MIPYTETGFRKRHSSTDAFILVTNTVNESRFKNNVLVAAFLDFEGACDNMDHYILLAKLASLGLLSKLSKFHSLCRFSLLAQNYNNQRSSRGCSPELPPLLPISLGNEPLTHQFTIY